MKKKDALEDLRRFVTPWVASCPFCGGYDATYKETQEGKFYVECKVCKAKGPEEFSRESARCGWNNHEEE